MEAVEFILRRIAEWPSAISDIDEVQARIWISEAREQLQSIATTGGLELRDLACTLLVAVLGSEKGVFMQVGDGAWIAENEGECRPITWPMNGEYANETTFITSPAWAESLQFCVWNKPISGIAGFTDGVQALSLHFASKAVHAPFFEPMFAALRGASDELSLIPLFHAFLDSPQVNGRTDDDKTLVLACRIPNSNSNAPV